MLFYKKCVKRLLICSLFLAPIHVFADIDHTKLKGVHGLLRPSYQQLSPVYGFSLLKKGIIENLYKNGPDDDAVVKLIRSLFYTVDQANFGVSRLPSNLASRLDTKAIGAILAELATDPENLPESTITGIDGSLESRLSSRIHQLLGLDEGSPIGKQLTRKERQIFRKKTREFVSVLLAAIQESSGSQRVYPLYFPEHVLLSFFWSKAKDEKEEFLELFKQAPHLLTDEGILLIDNPEKRFAWIESNYSVQDYYKAVGKIKLGERIEESSPAEFLLNPELAAFVGYSFLVWENFLPTIVSYGDVSYFGKGKEEEFSDCAETSIRNFFNIVLKNTVSQKIDIERLKERAMNENLVLDAKLLSFYEKNFGLSMLGSSQIHSEWSEVVSNLANVVYLQPEDAPLDKRFCNISGGFDSTMSVFGRLIFSNDPTFEMLDRVERLNRVVNFFSRPDFELDWEIANDEKSSLNEKNIEITIKFLVNGLPSFTWSFDLGHFFIKPVMEVSSDNWRQALGERIAMISAKVFYFKERPLHELQASLALSTLSWFVFPSNVDKIISELSCAGYPQGDYQIPLWTFSFSREAEKLIVVENILPRHWSRLYPLTLRLIAQMSSEAYHRSQVVELLASNGDESFKEFIQVFLNRLSSGPESKREFLTRCIQNEYLSLIRLLIEKFGKELLNESNPRAQGRLPLQEAITMRTFGVVKMLVQYGANVLSSDNKGATPLHSAAGIGSEIIVQFLLEHGADMNAEDEMGLTALQYATKSKHFEVVKVLIENGASSGSFIPEPTIVPLNVGNVRLLGNLRDLYLVRD
ncbi:MAG: ankyrin repeat domain-containing protein [Bdellovibrionia bacterium]